MKIEKIFGDFPIIESDKILLGKITENDLDELFEIYDNENVFKYCGIIPKHNKDTVKKMIPHFERDFNKETIIKWGIYDKNTMKLMGILEIGNYNKKINMVTIGYFLAEKNWNKGITGEAIKLLIKYLFDIVEVNRIQAEVMPENENSRKVLLKNNFISEGVIREGSIWPGKGIVDLEIFSILKREYKKK